MNPSSRNARAAAAGQAPSSASALAEAALRQTLSDRIRVCRQLGVRVPPHLRRGTASDLLLRVSLLDHRLTRTLELRGGVCLRDAHPPAPPSPPDPPEPELPPAPWEPPEEEWEDDAHPDDEERPDSEDKGSRASCKR